MLIVTPAQQIHSNARFVAFRGFIVVHIALKNTSQDIFRFRTSRLIKLFKNFNLIIG